MRFVYVTDSHQKGVNPIRRKGHFESDILKKFEYVVSFGASKKVDFFLHGADLFDTPYVTNMVADRLADVMESVGIPWYLDRGNHDTIGHNPENSEASILDHLYRRSGLIRHLDCIIDEKSSVYIKGMDHYHNIELDLMKKAPIIGSNGMNCKYRILMPHAYIAPDGRMPSMATYVRCEDFHSDFTDVLSSHFHGYWGKYTVNNTNFWGIGALCRLSISKDDIERGIYMLYFDSDVGFEILPVPHKKVEEIFIFDDEVKIEDVDFSASKFFENLDSYKVQGMNLKHMVEEVGVETKTEQMVIDDVVNRIGELENKGEGK